MIDKFKMPDKCFLYRKFYFLVHKMNNSAENLAIVVNFENLAILELQNGHIGVMAKNIDNFILDFLEFEADSFEIFVI